MGAGHPHPLYLAGCSPVHRMRPEVKIAACALGIGCVVATPATALPAFAGFFALLAVIWAVAGIPPGWLARRALIEAPFVMLAVLLPITGPPPRAAWLGLSVSGPGLLSAWSILSKGTLGVLTSLTLTATTPARQLLTGLHRLRAPALVTTIATLMLRYVEVIAAEAGRMRLARISRGHDPRFLWQAAATARGIASLFLRSYERGERVHLAMLSRGWTGGPPPSAEPDTTVRQWLIGLAPLLPAIALAVAGRVLT